MNRLDEIERDFRRGFADVTERVTAERSKLFVNRRSLWTSSYGDLLIRAVRQLGNERNAIKESDPEIYMESPVIVDPDVLALLKKEKE